MILRVVSLFFIFFGVFIQPLCAQDDENNLWDASEDEFYKENRLKFLASGDTSYFNLWLEVDSLNHNDFVKSGDSVVKQIYNNAWRDKNYPQTIKALLYQLKYAKRKSELDLLDQLKRLESEIKRLPAPHKHVLQSITGSAWVEYGVRAKKVKNLVKKFELEPDSTIPQFWERWRIDQEAEKYFLASISHPEVLKAVPVQNYSAVIKLPEQSERFQPVLFDVLMWRAYRFYTRKFSFFVEQSYPADFCFGDIKTFISHNFRQDTLLKGDLKMAAQLLQRILKHNYNTQQIDAYVWGDMERVKFMRKFNRTGDNDSLIMLWYDRQIQKYSKQKIVVELYYTAAKKMACASQYTDYRKRQYGRCNNAKALKYCQAAIAKFPNEWTTEKCRKLAFEITRVKLNGVSEYSVLAKQPFKYLVRYKNVPKLFVKYISISTDSLRAIKNRDYGEDKHKRILNQLLKYPVIDEQQVILPNDSTFFNNSTEWYHKGLPQGHYVMLFSEKEDFRADSNATSYTELWSSNYTIYSTHTGDDNYTYFVADARNNKPVKGATILLKHYNYRIKERSKRYSTYKEGITDKNGTFSFKQEESISLEAEVFVKGKRVIATKGSNYLNRYRGRSKSNIRTYYFTDRNIYRPGQTVYFKGVTVKGVRAGVPEVGRVEKVELEDANREVVAKGAYKTNAYGSFSGSFVIPFGSINGRYVIRSEHGLLVLRVEEYKRPKFQVSINPYKGTASFGDTVTITGKAIAFAGNALDGATLVYTVVQGENSFYFSRKYGLTDEEEKRVVKSGTLNLDAKGNFTVSFVAPSGNKKYNTSYKVLITVTDITGETHETETNIKVGKRTVFAKIDAEREVFAQPETEIVVRGENLNEHSVPVEGILAIHTLEIPETVFVKQFWEAPLSPIIDEATHRKLFPYFAVNKENQQENYKVRQQVFTATIKDSSGFASTIWNTEKVKSGVYLITFTYLDNLGDTQKVKKYMPVVNPKSKTAFPHQNLVISSKHKIYEPNQTAEVLLSSRFPKTRVIYFISKQGKATQYQAKLNNGIHKIKIPITENDRGDIHISAFAVHNNRFYREQLTLKVPYSNKELKVEVKSYRDKMQPGDKEEWELKISGKDAQKVSAEIVAAMYDASLDKIKKSIWYDFTENYRPKYRNRINPRSTTHTKHWVKRMHFYTSPKFEIREHKLPGINFYNWIEDPIYLNGNTFYDGFGGLIGSGSYSAGGLGMGGYGRGGGGMGGNSGSGGVALSARSKSSYGRKSFKDESRAMEVASEQAFNTDAYSGEAASQQSGFDMGLGFSDATFIKVRRKLDETAFFYPHLVTSDSGYVTVKFVAPEALTKWKFRAFAYTKDLSSGYASINTLTQKPLMVQTNMPRFLREGDEIYISAKVVNLSGKELSPNAVLEVYDATTGRNIPEFNNINMLQVPQIQNGVSQSVKWLFKVPEGYGALKFIIKAYDGNFTDAEANTIPALSNKVLLTETKTIDFSGKAPKTYELEKLTTSKQNSTLKHHKLTVEFTTNPAWYAIQALPYMMEYPYECAEQTFNRMYANMLAYHIANSSPKIKEVFDSWKAAAEKGNADAFLSNLEKNQELKNLLLQETPWLTEGRNESERKLRLGKLFDENHMSTEISAARTKLFNMQKRSGAFPWFRGMGDNRTLTQYVVAGVGKLNKITGKRNITPEIKKAIKYMSKKAQREYREYGNSRRPSFHIIQYLYALSFYPNGAVRDRMVQYNNLQWRKSVGKHWQKCNLMERAMIAVAFKRTMGGKRLAERIVKSFEETAIVDVENGMYWKQSSDGYSWKDAPIETHCLIMEAFAEVSKDTNAINLMRKWLLKQKQLNDWKTTKATADACYALLLNGNDWLETENTITLAVGDKTINPKTDEEVSVEAGTGYIKKSFAGDVVTPKMGKVTVTPNANKDIPMAFGALYWQYFESLDKVTYAQSPLSIVKQVFVQETTDSSKRFVRLAKGRKIKVGTKLRVKILLNVSNTMEYVHLKDMRAAALEPLENISGYKYKNGAAHYLSIKDASMNFFFDKLRKGQWVFEYDLVASQSGTFQNGIATVQSMYAPQYTSHSDGLVITVEP